MTIIRDNGAIVYSTSSVDAYKSLFIDADTLGGAARLIRLPQVHDIRGNLTFVESNEQIPYSIERVYYLYDVPSGAERAAHAHKELRQTLIAMSGSFDVHIENGSEKVTVHLNRPDVGLYMESLVWRDIDNFSGGAVCVVLANAKYDERDYIRDYQQYLEAVRGT